jgi:hypothetical protein
MSAFILNMVIILVAFGAAALLLARYARKHNTRLRDMFGPGAE